MARVYGSLGAYQHVLGHTTEEQNYFAKSMTLAEKLGLEELLLLPYNVIGRTLAVVGDFSVRGGIKTVVRATHGKRPEL